MIGEIAAEGPVAAFMARVLDDPSAQARFAGADDVPAFVAATVAFAADHGIVLDPADLTARLRPDPLGLDRFAPAPVTLDRWPGRGWMPVQSAPHADPFAVDWAFFGDAPLSEPLYVESARRAAALPFNRMFRTRTTLEALVGDVARWDVAAPSGFVFHMSRCGSTLAGRMLMAIPGVAVASEPEPLDAVLTWAALSGASQDDQVAALRAIVAALGRERIAGQQHFFLKLDAWHALMLPLFRAAFPDVPWIYLYRDPVEVITSHMAEPGVHYVPGVLPPALAALDVSGATSEPDYCARILAEICRAVVAHWPLGGGMAVRFDDIVAAMTTTVPNHFGVALDVADRAAMDAVATVDAKRPSARFTPDSVAKQKMASPEVFVAAKRHLAEPIASLDKLRGGDIQADNYS